jgi:hypothetical protein
VLIATGKEQQPKEENKFSGKIRTVLGSGVTVTRHALDVEFGVRIPAPQLKKIPCFSTGDFA